MLTINIGKRAEKYLRRLPKKHALQIAVKLRELQSDPSPSGSKKLKGSEFYRVDIGEHRIIFFAFRTTLFIPLIGKRNDNEVYRRLKRLER